MSGYNKGADDEKETKAKKNNYVWIWEGKINARDENDKEAFSKANEDSQRSQS